MSEPADLDLELTGAQRATLSSLLKGEEAIQPPEWLTLEAAVDDESERARAADDPDDLSRLRLLACAGEPLNPEAHRWAQKHLVGQGDGTAGSPSSTGRTA